MTGEDNRNTKHAPRSRSKQERRKKGACDSGIRTKKKFTDRKKNPGTRKKARYCEEEKRKVERRSKGSKPGKNVKRKMKVSAR